MGASSLTLSHTISILSSPTKNCKSNVWNPDLIEGGRTLGLSLKTRFGTNMHQPSHKGAQFLASKSWISVWKEKKNTSNARLCRNGC